MKSRWLVNLLLLAGVALLATLAWLEPGLEEPPPPEKVTTLAREDIDRIEIQRARQDNLLLEKDDDGQWWIRREPPLPADRFHVDALVKLADQEITRSYPADEMDLSVLKLDPPASSITLNETRIDFGRQEALEKLRYALRGDRVLLIPDLYQYLVDADWTQFVRRRLFGKDQRISAIRLPGLSLEKQDGRWQVTPEADAELSADDIQQFIERWEAATAVMIGQAANDGKTRDGDGEYVEIDLVEPEEHLRFRIQRDEDGLKLVREDAGIRYDLGSQEDRLLKLEASPPEDTPENSGENEDEAKD